MRRAAIATAPVATAERLAAWCRFVVQISRNWNCAATEENGRVLGYVHV